jgi:hypothetical protein
VSIDNPSMFPTHIFSHSDGGLRWDCAKWSKFLRIY